MMKAKLPFFILFLFIWFGCDEDSNNQEWVDVSYVTPMYKSTSDLADEIFLFTLNQSVIKWEEKPQVLHVGK